VSDQVTTPLLMAIDGNSLLHRAHHAHEHSGQRDLGGRPTWGLRGMVAAIGGAAARLGPDGVVIGFDCALASRRRDEYPQYKAGRAAKSAELLDQLSGAVDLLRACGFAVVQHEGWEADDVMSSSAALARASGWRCTVVTSDRDAFALIDESTSVLRIIAGGVDASPLLTPARLPLLCGVRAGQYRDYAALRGDVSDNLPGATGIGAKTAAKLLTAFGGVADVYAALDGGRESEVVAAVGPAAARRLAEPQARANVARNMRLMAMRVDLPLPGLDAMQVPMDLVRMQSALLERDIRLGPSLWALTGSAPPGEDTWAWIAEQQDVAPPPVAPPTVAPVVQPVAEDDQLSLF
jgi:DNA polymerase-1